ncbi:solute carrier family 35 (UDP-sugar transporter), member A1/2/3, partial [Phenoliferia sp. Uapishka_3]
MSAQRSMLSPRNLSLAAVCTQSTVLAIVLHVSQSHLHPGQAPFKASSAVLMTEVGKLVISFLLALRDTINERRLLRRPVHKLPSPELYAGADEVYEKDIYREAPYDLPISSLNDSAKHSILRRRSSSIAPATLGISLDCTQQKMRFPELANFAWARPPLTPTLSGKEVPEELLELKFDEPLLWKRRNETISGLLLVDIFGSDWYKMAVPAVLFAIQNNLIYVAARNLSVPVFQVTFQLKTLITAIAAVTILGRRFAPAQWISFVFLALGVATMQIGALRAKASDSHVHTLRPEVDNEDQNYLMGITSVIVSCVCSSVAATYFELVIKRRPDGPPLAINGRRAPTRENKPASLWVRNVQLSGFSTILGIIVVLVQANPAHWAGGMGFSLDMNDPLEHWYDPVVRTAVGFFTGFHPMAWLVIGLQTFGGLLIAVAIKHADNVAKGFALSLSIVFTFLLSVILFDFQLTLPSILGGLAVVGSTLLFEMDDTAFRTYLRPELYGRKAKPLVRGHHYIILTILAVTFTAAIHPMRRFSVTTAAWELVQSRLESPPVHTRPTVSIADMTQINEKLAAAGLKCGWGPIPGPHRESTLAPYGARQPMARASLPFTSSLFGKNTYLYTLDNILTTRFTDYSHNIPLLSSSPSPDFIFVPILAQLYSNPWGCQDPDLLDSIKQTTSFIRDLVASVGPTPYPRIIIPVATIRSNLERQLFSPELMEEIKDSVIVVSIEGAPKSHKEAMKYMIDVPYPSAFHLSELVTRQSDPEVNGVHASKIRKEKSSVGQYFLHQDRPFLLYHAAAATHPWGLSPSDPFNGFALRSALRTQLNAFVDSPSGSDTHIIFNDIKNPVDDVQNLTMIHEDMQRAVFCPMPPGDSPTRRAMYEAILLGCIPVIFRDRSYGRLFPSSPDINDVSKYTVFVDEQEIINGEGDTFIQRLEMVPHHEIRRMQQHLSSIASRLQWGLPSEDLHFPVVATSQRMKLLPAGMAVWNQTESLAAKAKKVFVPDAFSTLLKELDAIKEGLWVAQTTRDTRKGVTLKHFGSWRAPSERR